MLMIILLQRKRYQRQHEQLLLLFQQCHCEKIEIVNAVMENLKEKVFKRNLPISLR